MAPDSRTLAVGFGNGIAKLIDTASWQERGTLRGGEGEEVLCLAFSPDGNTLAAAGAERIIRLWDLATARPRQMLIGHGDLIESLAFSPDGRTLVSGSRDGTVRFWSPVSGRELLAVEMPVGIERFAFSEDGKRLAGSGRPADGGGSHIYLWTAATEVPEKTLEVRAPP